MNSFESLEHFLYVSDQPCSISQVMNTVIKALTG